MLRIFTRVILCVISVAIPCMGNGRSAQKSPKPAPQPTFWIVFERLDVPMFSLEHFPSIDIFLMDQNGSHTKRLTSNHRSHNPSWSPDGRQIVFLTGESAPSSSIGSDDDFSLLMQFQDILSIPLDVFRMDADGRNPARVASLGPDAQDVFWFRDGKRVGVRMSARAALQVVVDLSGSFLRAIQYNEPLKDYLSAAKPLLSGAYSDKYSELLVWVPPVDNFMPMFVSSRGFDSPYLDRLGALPSVANLTASLRVLSLDGTPTPFPLAAYDLAWCLDGKRIAYSAFSGEQKAILYVAEMQGDEVVGNGRALTDQALDSHGPAWSADGSRIAFTGLWEDSSQIFVVGADGAGLLQLSRNPKTSCYHPSWSPDGKWIVADCRDSVTVMQPLTYELGGLSSIYLFDMTKLGTKPRQLTKCAPMFPLPAPTCGARNPSFAPVPIP